MAGYIGTKAVNLSTTGADINGNANVDGTLDVTGATTLASADINGDMSFGDNDKAIFGAGSDFQIYHDGFNSYIADTATGSLHIKGTSLFLEDADGNEFIRMSDQGAGGVVYLKNLGATKLTTTSTGIAVTGDATFGNNGKAIFGAGSDLQIWHDGFNSYVSDAGTGNLNIQSNGTQINLQKPDGTKMIEAINNGNVVLYSNGIERLRANGTGIDVTGTVTSDGLTVDGDSSRIDFTGTSGSNVISSKRGIKVDIDSDNDQGATAFDITRDGETGTVFTAKENGDVSFYEDTGTTAKFFWDASAESLGLSNAAAGSALVITKGNTTGNALEISNSGESRSLDINHNADGTGTVDEIVRIKNNGTSKFVIDASGNVGIGTATPSLLQSYGNTLVVGSGSGAHGMTIYSGPTEYGALLFADGTGTNAELRAGEITYDQGSSSMFIKTAATERLRIDASGNVGIGTSAPSTKLDVSGDTTGVLRIKHNYSYSQPNWAIKIDGEVGTPAGYLSQSGASGGFALTSGGVYYGGGNYKADANATAFGGIQSTGGAFTFTNATGLTGGQVFSGSQVMRIDASGNVLVGTTSSVPNSIGYNCRLVAQTAIGVAGLHLAAHQTTVTTMAAFSNGNGQVGSITATGSTTAYNTSSDYRLKENITPVQGATDIVKAMKPCTYTFKSDGSWHDGFLAHELQELHPRAVVGSKDAMRDEEYEVTPAVYEDITIPAVEAVAEVPAVYDDEGVLVSEMVPAVEAQPERTEQQLVSEAVMGTRSVPDYQGVDYSKLTPILTAALQEALNKIEVLEARLTALEATP